jgi:hypothetical protein
MPRWSRELFDRVAAHRAGIELTAGRETMDRRLLSAA